MALAIELPPSPLAQTKPEEASRKSPIVRVPFVGCRSDGQVGPMAAPKGSAKPVQIDVSLSQKLAYYKATNTSGVLAPRGWYCFETYGSGGSTLFLAPQPLKTPDLFSTTWRGFTGPVIQVSAINGDTSGRFEVARIIARYFPAQMAFVQSVIKEGIEPASQFPSGPYPKDKLTYLNDQIVEYQTPAHSEGLGTVGQLQKNDDPIYGVAILQGKTPDLLLLTVRLPPDKHDLAAPIIQQIEQDNVPRK
jgi:hypothetical protein